MRAGKLRKLATVQQLVTTRSPMGQEEEGYEFFAVVWAGVEFATSGTEAYQAVQRVGVIDAKVTVRYRPGYVAGMRVVIDGQTYKVDSVAEAKPRNEVHLLCTVLEAQSGPVS